MGDPREKPGRLPGGFQTLAIAYNREVHKVYSQTRNKMATPEYTFVDAVDDALKCHFCKKVAENPQQHENCGGLICRECLVKDGREKPCPKCGEVSNYYVDKKST